MTQYYEDVSGWYLGDSNDDLQWTTFSSFNGDCVAATQNHHDRMLTENQVEQNVGETTLNNMIQHEFDSTIDVAAASSLRGGGPALN